MTTDPQTAADAAERNDAAAACAQAWLDGRSPIMLKAAVRTLLWERAELLADRARMAAELEQARGDSRDAYIASLFSEPVECECGCLPGQPCECSVHDCECIGDCPVCDADGMTYAIGDAKTAAMRPAGGTTGPAESQRTHTPATGSQQGFDDRGD